jgi:hypothetical protein
VTAIDDQRIVQEALAKGQRDCQLLDARDFNEAPWDEAQAALVRLGERLAEVAEAAIDVPEEARSDEVEAERDIDHGWRFRASESSKTYYRLVSERLEDGWAMEVEGHAAGSDAARAIDGEWAEAFAALDRLENRCHTYEEALRQIADAPCANFPHPPPKRVKDVLVWPSNCIKRKYEYPCAPCIARAALASSVKEPEPQKAGDE